jgi:acyl-CoA thioesterase FadM
MTKIGEWKFPDSSFTYFKEVFFKQTNMLGNTYFSNYIEWMGEAREKLFLSHPSAPIYLNENPSIIMITHTLHHRFLKNSYFGDRICIEVKTNEILDYSLIILFKFINVSDNTIIGEGWQKVCFWNKQTDKPCKVPQIFLDLALPIKEI